MKYLTLIMMAMLFISCGKDTALWPKQEVTIQKIAPAVEEEYSYELRGNSCTTGVHSSESFFKICDRLLDHTENNDCAEEKRKELFETSKCAGEFI